MKKKMLIATVVCVIMVMGIMGSAFSASAQSPGSGGDLVEGYFYPAGQRTDVWGVTANIRYQRERFCNGLESGKRLFTFVNLYRKPNWGSVILHVSHPTLSNGKAPSWIRCYSSVKNASSGAQIFAPTTGKINNSTTYTQAHKPSTMSQAGTNIWWKMFTTADAAASTSCDEYYITLAINGTSTWKV